MAISIESHAIAHRVASHNLFLRAAKAPQGPILRAYPQTLHPRPLSPQAGRGENVLG